MENEKCTLGPAPRSQVIEKKESDLALHDF
jgi:hypothetical protein